MIGANDAESPKRRLHVPSVNAFPNRLPID